MLPVLVVFANAVGVAIAFVTSVFATDVTLQDFEEGLRRSYSHFQVFYSLLKAAILGAIRLTRGGIRPGYPLYAKFPWGANLKTGQPVLLVGVNVGVVDNVELKQDGTLITTFRVSPKYKVPLGTTASVIPNGIFG